MTKEERRALKVWLTELLPEGMSRNDVADDLGVTRKTISSMLNPESQSFANGLTMLRYLRLAGAVVDAPADSPASSRLAALEAKVDGLATKADLQRGLDVLRAAIDALASRDTRPGTGTDGR